MELNRVYEFNLFGVQNENIKSFDAISVEKNS